MVNILEPRGKVSNILSGNSSILTAGGKGEKKPCSNQSQQGNMVLLASIKFSSRITCLNLENYLDHA